MKTLSMTINMILDKHEDGPVGRNNNIQPGA
jgi:hypothetical protein